MKNVMVMILLFLGAVSSHAKGGADKNPSIVTSASFIAESVETSIRRLTQIDAVGSENTMVGVRAVKTVSGSIEVIIQMQDGSTKIYSCELFDDVSQGGNAIKKDVRCL
ncbi:MAG: hypothetical protein ACK5WZ_14750 [Pseudobdellovibrionaceae bacterium]|jgi:hypothetical protein